ncbi:MAG: REDY-like protein HapK [Pseudomonadota bacterium]
MTVIIALFNLQDAAAKARYEAWALDTDLPTVRKMDSVDRFDTLRTKMLLGTDSPPPYEYIEIIELNDFDRFREEVATETMQRVAGEFRDFARDPQFIVCELLDGGGA